MHGNHSRVAVDLENILQCGSAESKKLFFFCLRKHFSGLVKRERVYNCRVSRVADSENCRGSKNRTLTVKIEPFLF